MRLTVPKYRLPLEQRGVPLNQIAARWKRPVWFVRHVFLMAGVPLTRVPQPPVDGVHGKDLLAFEQRYAGTEIDALLTTAAFTEGERTS